MREGIAKHGGYEINTEGDAFQVAFTTVHQVSLRCQIQTSCGDIKTFLRNAHSTLYHSTSFNGAWPWWLAGGAVLPGDAVPAAGERLAARGPQAARLQGGVRP